MGLCSYISYVSVVGLAVQSTRWDQSMKDHLVEMSFHVAKAVELQDGAAFQHIIATETKDKAALDQAEGTNLEEDGEDLISQGNADSILSAADKINSEKLAAKAVNEEEMAAADMLKSAAQEEVVNESIAKATADTSLAVKHDLITGEDGLVVATCEIIPFLDFVCDVIGGAISIGLETNASQEAARATAEYAAAASAQDIEDSIIAEADELHANAIRDANSASELEITSAELKAKAEEEISDGEADEIAAKAKLAESQTEMNAAAENEMEAAEQEKIASNHLEKSLRSGLEAWSCAILAAISSLFAFVFFIVRFFFTILYPGPKHSKKRLRVKSDVPFCFTVRTLSQVFHHFFLVGLVSTLFGNFVFSLEGLTVNSRGSLLLQLAATVAILQSLLLHCHSNAIVRESNGWREMLNVGLLVFVRCSIVLWALITIEICIVCVIFGVNVVSSFVISFFWKWYIVASFTITLTAHFILIERYEWTKIREGSDEYKDGKDVEQASLLSQDLMAKPNYGSYHIDKPRRDAPTNDPCTQIDLANGGALSDDQEDRNRGTNFEKISFISKIDLEDIMDHEQNETETTIPFHHLLWRDFQLLIFPFELLVVTVLFVMLRDFFPALKQLWPIVKPTVTSMISSGWVAATQVQWYLIFAVIISCVLVLLTGRHLWLKCCAPDCCRRAPT